MKWKSHRGSKLGWRDMVLCAFLSTIASVISVALNKENLTVPVWVMLVWPSFLFVACGLLIEGLEKIKHG